MGGGWGQWAAKLLFSPVTSIRATHGLMSKWCFHTPFHIVWHIEMCWHYTWDILEKRNANTNAVISGIHAHPEADLREWSAGGSLNHWGCVMLSMTHFLNSLDILRKRMLSQATYTGDNLHWPNSHIAASWSVIVLTYISITSTVVPNFVKDEPIWFMTLHVPVIV